MGCEHRGIALLHFGPGASIRVVTIVSVPTRGSLVIGDDIGSREPEQVRPVSGSRRQLNDRRVARQQSYEMRLRQHIGVSMSELDSVAHGVGHQGASRKA